VDGFVLLTPLLALAVILLLGFTGCDKLFGLDEVKVLNLEARLPSSIDVIDARFIWTPPGSTNRTIINDVTISTEGPDVTLVLASVGLETGCWIVNCRLHVHDAVRQSTDAIDATFTIYANDPPVEAARFQTMGSPATHDFKVTYVGVVFENGA
jgi:hypothetical protein